MKTSELSQEEEEEGEGEEEEVEEVIVMEVWIGEGDEQGGVKTEKIRPCWRRRGGEGGGGGGSRSRSRSLMSSRDGLRKSFSYRSSTASGGSEADDFDEYEDGDDEGDRERYYRNGKGRRRGRGDEGEDEEEEGEEDDEEEDEEDITTSRSVEDGGTGGVGVDGDGGGREGGGGNEPLLAEQAAGDRLNFFSRLPFTVGIQKDTQASRALVKQRVVQVANYETAVLGFAVLTYFLDSNVAPGTADTTMSLL